MESGRIDEVAEILHQAAETHHIVWAITDGDDADWATWYSDWLVRLSRLPDVLGVNPPRSQLTRELVQLEGDYSESGTDEPWEHWYAERLIESLTS